MMFKMKPTLMTIVVAGLIGLLCASLSAQQLYLDITGTNDIYRYDANLDPDPAPGQSGVTFANFSGTDKYKSMAAGADGYLYFTCYNDLNPAGPWPWPVQGSNHVQRIDMTTGVLDPTWSVGPLPDQPDGNSAQVYSLAFAPDGKLYASDRKNNTAYYVDIAAKTFAAKFGDGPTVTLQVYVITFDDQGRAYGSSYTNKSVYRWTESGGNFTPDPTFWNVPVGVEGDNAFGLAWKDGYLYATSYYTTIVRFNTSTNTIDPNWQVTGFDQGGGVYCMAFGPDGKLYVGGGTKVWRVDMSTQEKEELPSLGGQYRQLLSWSDTSWHLPTSVSDATISFQGKLPDQNGQPVNGTADIKFDLFDLESGGTALWSGTAGNVAVTDGVFSKGIGPVAGTVFTDHSSMWLQVTANGQVMSPRLNLNTAPYAARAIRTAP